MKNLEPELGLGTDCANTIEAKTVVLNVTSCLTPDHKFKIAAQNFSYLQLLT